MEFDLHRSLSDQHGSAEALQRHILEAASFGTKISLGTRNILWRVTPSHPQTKSVKSSIRFFIPSTPASRTPSWRLKKASSSVFDPDTAETSTRFRVTGLNSLSGPHKYLAVSYCWPRGAEKERLKDSNEFYWVHDERCGEKRKTRALKSIIDRAVAFAKDRRISMIWIDQECIDQNDREDKECGIRSMDGIFHRAEKVVAFLQKAAINDRAEAEALRRLSHHQHLDAGHYRIGIEVVKRISEDPWFTRAWTLQEATSGGNTLELSMKCDPDLKRGDTEEWGFVKNEIQFDWAHIEKWIGGLYAQAALYDQYPPPTLDSSERIDLHGKIDSIRTSLMNHFPLKLEPTRMDRPRLCCNASTALMFLKQRANSRPPDRISILANLGDYSIKLNTTKIGDLNMSACIIAQALLNGDLSLLSGVDKIHWAREQEGSSFSWLPPLDLTLEDITPYHERHQSLRLSDHSISEKGLSLPGYCWDVNQRLDLQAFRRKFTKRWAQVERPTEQEPTVMSLLRRFHLEKEESMDHFHSRLLEEAEKYSTRNLKHSQDEYGASARHVVGSQILWGLLCHLVKLDRLNLANSIWHSARARYHSQTPREMQNGSSKELPAALDQFVVQEKGKRRLEVPYFKANFKVSRLFVHMEDNWEWLIERIMNEGILWTGHSTAKHSARTSRSAFCVFDVSSPCIIFTPHCKGMEVMEDYGRLMSPSLPPMRSKRISWIIEAPSAGEDCAFQRGLQTRRGRNVTRRKTWVIKISSDAPSPHFCTTKGMVAGMWKLGKIKPTRLTLI